MPLSQDQDSTIHRLGKIHKLESNRLLEQPMEVRMQSWINQMLR
jgi:hypothetical protein